MIVGSVGGRGVRLEREDGEGGSEGIEPKKKSLRVPVAEIFGHKNLCFLGLRVFFGCIWGGKSAQKGAKPRTNGATLSVV